MIKEIKINGMSCAHCVAAVEKELKKLNPEKLEVTIGSAKIEYAENVFSDEDISKAIKEAGFTVIEQKS